MVLATQQCFLRIQLKIPHGGSLHGLQHLEVQVLFIAPHIVRFPFYFSSSKDIRVFSFKEMLYRIELCLAFNTLTCIHEAAWVFGC